MIRFAMLGSVAAADVCLGGFVCLAGELFLLAVVERNDALNTLPLPLPPPDPRTADGRVSSATLPTGVIKLPFAPD